MSDTRRRGRAIKEQVLVAAVTAAERGDLMPSTSSLATKLACRSQDISMALLALERKGLVKRLGRPGLPQRVLVISTGAATAEVPMAGEPVTPRVKTPPAMRQLRRG